MSALRRAVAGSDVHGWASRFLEDLAAATQPSARAIEPTLTAPGGALEEAMRQAKELHLFLDYDGTLVPIAATPDLAAPDEELRRLLGALARRERTHVHVVSGRGRDVLQQWLGDLPISLHAEHGFWSRTPDGTWRAAREERSDWKAVVRPIIDDVARRTAGSLVEEKRVSLAWHYRLSDPELSAERLRELRGRLTDVARSWDLELLAGAKVCEVRVRGVNKGLVAAAVLPQARPDGLAVAIGDDRTDEDLFAAMPATAICIHVGAGITRAGHRLANPADVRALLARLL
jgi:trehalose 6-phosphate synthase/phosphatase